MGSFDDENRALMTFFAPIESTILVRKSLYCHPDDLTDLSHFNLISTLADNFWILDKSLVEVNIPVEVGVVNNNNYFAYRVITYSKFCIYTHGLLMSLYIVLDMTIHQPSRMLVIQCVL